MKKNLLKKILAGISATALFSSSIASAPIFSRTFAGAAFAYTEKSAAVKIDNMNVRSGAGTEYSKIITLKKGTQVTITDEVKLSDGAVWYKINYEGGSGYASKANIKLTLSNYSSDPAFESSLNSQGFPESYKPYLREIHAEYPNWTFKTLNTGLDWEDAVQNESVIKRNLVHRDSISSWKSTASGAYDWNNSSWPGFDSNEWVAASEGIISYYMDPRNFLDSTYVFQFLNHKYDSSMHSAGGVGGMIRGSFMAPAHAETQDLSAQTSGPSGNEDRAVREGTDSPSESAPKTSEVNSSAGSPGSSESIGSYAPEAGYSGNISLEAPKTTESSGENGEDNLSTSGPGVTPGTKVVTAGGPSSGNSAGRKATPDLSANSGPGLMAGPGAVPDSGKVSDPGRAAGSPVRSAASLDGGYVDIIMKAASESGVNPYVLTSMILQEQGTGGSSGLISGNTPPYNGVYNFFNIEAYQAGGQTATLNGLKWASQSGSYGRPWNSIEKAITGGAKYYGENYVNAGQDTFYLKKFNVQGSNIYKHQYMSNIEGAAFEGAKLAGAYSESLKSTALEFEIPVYNNMPEEPVQAPQGDGSPNNKLAELSVSGFNLTPTFNRDIESYDLIVDGSVSQVNIAASAIHSKAAVSGTGSITLDSGNTSISVEVKAENGNTRNYRINIVRQN